MKHRSTHTHRPAFHKRPINHSVIRSEIKKLTSLGKGGEIVLSLSLSVFFLYFASLTSLILFPAKCICFDNHPESFCWSERGKIKENKKMIVRKPTPSLPDF
ncbi:hypothetical protein BDV27DRAFT_124375 [Aspergillus caelatus]|uniref:Uncharacterized protein n=1 Tax=Aspergillus caelatus TaxID=61420 RepID=A0A5N7ABD2_9EURO|nr:uncharacterized protein BDV27DRAFT_124375 [Aspergillus caelatus]KAE8367164.1 hypothetical protein BDV27DRAFT_124375 [Aspergillus caelatus]